MPYKTVLSLLSDMMCFVMRYPMGYPMGPLSDICGHNLWGPQRAAWMPHKALWETHGVSWVPPEPTETHVSFGPKVIHRPRTLDASALRRA